MTNACNLLFLGGVLPLHFMTFYRVNKKNNVKDYRFNLAIYDSKISPGFPKGKTKFAETEEEWRNQLLAYSDGGMLTKMVLQGE